MHEVTTVLEGFFAGCLLRELFSAGMFERLRSPTAPPDLALALHYDEAALRSSLEFLARTTRTLERVRGGRYRLGPDLRSAAGIVSVAKFLGAYGPAAFRARSSWRSARRAAQHVDRGALASAFSLAPRDPAAVIDLVRKRARTGLLDLGCGTGSLLATVCKRGGPLGWGIDESHAMCRAARCALRRYGLNRRVRVRCADATRPTRVLDSAERAQVDVIHAASLFNALMRPPARAVRLLRALRRTYPGRTLINVDYLGVLTRPQDRPPLRGATLQDIAQVLSGQGIPPQSHDGWAHLYRDAGCTLTDVVEVRTTGLRWFVHTVTL